MLLSAMSVLVVAQSSSEVPEGLMNNPVFLSQVYCIRQVVNTPAIILNNPVLVYRIHHVTVGEFHGRGLPVCWNKEGLLKFSPLDMVVTLVTVSVAPNM